MTIHLVFTAPRLLVGWRRCDYHDVWYEPILTHDGGSEQKADGTFKMQLTLGATGKHKPDKDPDPEEVLWYPQFDWKNCEAEGKKVQQKMQRKILYNAWRFCMATDEHEVKQLVAELENRDFVRWDSWFRHAKKWKEGQMKRKGKRRVSRKAKNDQARRNGVSNEDIEQSLMDTSEEEDETYETDLEEAEREKAAKKPREAMGPPLLPTNNPSGGQRRGRGNGPPLAASKKRPRPGAKAPKGSAGLASRFGGNTLGSNRPIVDDTEDDNDEDDNDDDTISHPWDSQPPEGPSRSDSPIASNAVPTNEFDGRSYIMGQPTTPGAPQRTNAAELAKRLGRRKLFGMPEPTVTSDGNDLPRTHRAGSVMGEEDRNNNNMDDDEAFNAALRASLQPVEHDVEMQQANQAGVEPEDREGRDGDEGGPGRDSGVGTE